MKTAIQELIEYIEKRYAGQVSQGIVIKARELLEKEKQQIIDACIEFGMHRDETNAKRGEEYYNLIYKK